MKVLRSTFEKYMNRKDELIDLIDDANMRKNTSAAEGDLSENADYQKAFSDLELYTNEYLDVVEIIEAGEPVDETTNFTEIEVGSKFKLTVNLKAKPLSLNEKVKIGVFNVEDKGSSEYTHLSGIVTMGGPSNNYIYEGVISTDSAIGKYLMGKPLGKYSLNNTYGEILEVVAEHC